MANRGLGYEAMQKNDWDKASEHFRRAAAQNVKDPQVHYLLALHDEPERNVIGKTGKLWKRLKKNWQQLSRWSRIILMPTTCLA